MEKIAVIGLGRVGLPLSLALAESGFMVHGIDIDAGHVAKLNNKVMPFLEQGADALLQKHSGSNFIPSCDIGTIKDADAIIITLGTPLDNNYNPDFSQIESIKNALLQCLKEGQLIILRSTVAPGTSESLKVFFEKESKKECGKDFFLAYCPERIAEGMALEELREVPQIIGGITDKCSQAAQVLFRKICKTCLITDAKSAELAKIFSNLHRYINFAIANEFAAIATEHERSIHEIIGLVNNGYKRGGLASPGFSAGPCLYKDGFFLARAMPLGGLIHGSFMVNENLPDYLVGKIRQKIQLKDKKAAILGMSFKRDIDDTRNSLSFRLKKILAREGCSIKMHDPFAPGFSRDLKACISGSDLIFIAVNHSEYEGLNRQSLRDMAGKTALICDIWNVTGENKIILDG